MGASKKYTATDLRAAWPAFCEARKREVLTQLHDLGLCETPSDGVAPEIFEANFSGFVMLEEDDDSDDR